jgi:hypothetical protein
MSAGVTLCYHIAAFYRSSTMASHVDFSAGDISPDPLLEQTSERYAMDVHALGGHFHFSSDSAALIDVVAMAYGGLPPHVLAGAPPRFQVSLRLAPSHVAHAGDEPPPVRMHSGAGFLCGMMDACNYAVLFPEQRRALVVASADMLANPYHLRYELIEFTVFMLAARALGLVPLHGACVGWRGRGALVMGSSGAGKSTLALHGLLRGMEFLAEDAVFVEPSSGLATGVANYLHVQDDALRFVQGEQAREWIARSPTIQRRSGARKYEVDLRDGFARLAPDPLALACVVFASRHKAARHGELMRPLCDEEIQERLTAEQPYAASQPGWDAFVRLVQQRGAYELLRGDHPGTSVDALLKLLG